VLAYYSNPSYDPNDVHRRNPPTAVQPAAEDPRKPLLDRVVGSGQPAASTWKLAVAGMALDLGAIQPDEYMPIACTGGLSYGRYWRCHWPRAWPSEPDRGHQELLQRLFLSGRHCASGWIATSSGLAARLRPRTGIDVPHEIAPRWPALSYWEDRLGYRPNDNEVNSLAIGQGPMNMTIIKLSHIYAALTAPNGRVPAPRLAMESGAPQDTFEFRTTPRDRWYLAAGMRRVVAPGGTAGRSRLPRWDFIGKTGTAQAPPGLDHGWFVGVGAPEVGAPPEIAVTMFLARSEHGYTASGYVGEVINFYLSRNYGVPFVKWATPRFRADIANLPPLDPQWFNRPVIDPPMPPPTAADQPGDDDDPGASPAPVVPPR
jgi:penicillin-binding protein 2